MASRPRAKIDEGNEEVDPNEPEEKKSRREHRGPVQKGLQYATLKLVLQSMDPNCRFRTALYCPSLRQMEKSIPLKINFLKFQVNSLKINDAEYILKVVQSVPLRPEPEIQLEIDGEEWQERLKITHTSNLNIANQDLRSTLFGGRKTITEVNQLEIGEHTTDLQLPEGLKFKVKTVHVHSCDIESFKIMPPIIHGSSFPLNRLWLHMARIDDMKLAIPQKGVKEVVVDICPAENSVELYQNLSENTYLNHHLFNHIDLFEHWKDHPPVVEKTLSVGYDSEERAKSKFDQLKAHNFEFCSMEKRCCTIVINKQVRVKMTVELKKTFNYKYDLDDEQWVIKMEVLIR